MSFQGKFSFYIASIDYTVRWVSYCQWGEYIVSAIVKADISIIIGYSDTDW